MRSIHFQLEPHGRLKVPKPYLTLLDKSLMLVFPLNMSLYQSSFCKSLYGTVRARLRGIVMAAKNVNIKTVRRITFFVVIEYCSWTIGTNIFKCLSDDECGLTLWRPFI